MALIRKISSPCFVPDLQAHSRRLGGEDVYGMVRGAFRREISQHLADHAAELVSVAGEPAGDGYLCVIRVRRDHEVLVRRVRVHASLRPQELTVEGGDVIPEIAAYVFHLFIVHGAVYGIRRTDRADTEERNLHTVRWIVVGRETVELHAVVSLPDPDRHPPDLESLHTAPRHEPELHEPPYLQRKSQVSEQLRRPRAG